MDYKLPNLINLENFKFAFENLYSATGINLSIVDLDGEVLTTSGDLDICRLFHKAHPVSKSYCIESNKYVVDYLKDQHPYICNTCKNGLVTIAIPIKLDNNYVATLYYGQFFLEKPDLNFFSNLADSLGFNKKLYLNEVLSVPMIPKEKLDSTIKFLINISGIIQKLSFSEIQEIEWNKKFQSNYQELEATYEELVATEEELRTQYEELQNSQRKLSRSEERYKLALLGSHDGIWDWDMINSTYYYSEKWANMLGYTKKNLSVQGKSWSTLIHPDDLQNFNNEISNYINRVTDKYKCEYRIKKQDDSYIWVSDVGAATWDEDGQPVRMVGSHTDITEQKKWSEEIHKMAYYDNLTGLPNKFSLYEDLKVLCENDAVFSVIYLDLDNFKSINDILGHSFGDKLLNKICFIFSYLINDNCTLYRWGGDEFVIILKNIEDENNIYSLMDEIVKTLNSPLVFEGHELFITASMGATIYPKDSNSPEDLIKNADTAMYQAKNIGKNTYQIYDPAFSQKALEQITLERELRKALKNNEFQVYYQPRIDIKTGVLVGMEALIRWIKPDGTIISPLNFIPKAEETGLIIPIGEFVLKAACKQIKEWNDKGYKDLVVSINLSAKQIGDKNLMPIIKSCIADYNINPSTIELEITESAVIQDMNQTMSFINELKDIGINVLLDDFGTGYSSLNFLRLLPVTTIKIDKSFIDKVEEDTTEKTIVQSLISLAHNIQLRVIAEGIEKPAQLDFLQNNSCDEAQGYYFSKPLSSLDFENLLKEKSK